MKTPTSKKLKITISCVAAFGDKEFSYIQIENALKEQKLSTFDFYRLIYAGAVDKIMKGIYKISPLFHTISAHEIYAKSNEKLKKLSELNSKKRLAEIQANNPTDLQTTIFPQTNNIDDAVALLKSLGYKIMKPTQGFEEI